MSRGAGLEDTGRLRFRLIAIFVAVTALSTLLFSFITLAAFDRAIAPELEQRTRLVGTLIRAELQQTLELGIPIDAISGLEAYVGATLRDFTEVQDIRIIAASGKMLADVQQPGAAAKAERTAMSDLIGIGGLEFRFPVLSGSDRVAEIVVTGNPQYVETRLRRVLLDVSVLALAIILIGVEAVLAYASRTLWKPYGRVISVLTEQSQGVFRQVLSLSGPAALRRLSERLNDRVRHLDELGAARGRATGGPRPFRLSEPVDARLALFLLALSTEITASFLPILSASADRPDWLPPSFAAAAPLVAYLVSVAACSLLAARVVRRIGARRQFLLAIVPIAASLVLMALSDTLAWIVVARAGVAMGYAFALAACQSYAIQSSPDGMASATTGAMNSALFGGVLSGSVIGGVIASQFGNAVAILLGAVCILAAGAVAARMMDGEASGAATHTNPRPAAAGGADRLRFGALVVGLALPMSAVTAIFIWYLIPLFLSESGFRTADVGRAVMLYYIPVVLLGPLVGQATRTGARAVLSAAFGAAMAGIVLLALSASPGAAPVILGGLGVGIAHTLMRSPVVSLALDWSGGATGLMDAYRLAERLGGILGLAVAATTLGDMRTLGVPPWVGLISLLGLAAFLAILAATARRGGAVTP